MTVVPPLPTVDVVVDVVGDYDDYDYDDYDDDDGAVTALPYGRCRFFVSWYHKLYARS